MMQVLESLGVQEVGMRVEPVHHSVDGFLDELVVRNGLDVVALDLAEHRGEELQVLVGDRRSGLALRDRGEIERKQDAEDRAQPDQAGFFPDVALGRHTLLPTSTAPSPSSCLLEPTLRTPNDGAKVHRPIPHPM